jgi:hypothetical protein
VIAIVSGHGITAIDERYGTSASSSVIIISRRWPSPDITALGRVDGIGTMHRSGRDRSLIEAAADGWMFFESPGRWDNVLASPLRGRRVVLAPHWMGVIFTSLVNRRGLDMLSTVVISAGLWMQLIRLVSPLSKLCPRDILASRRRHLPARVEQGVILRSILLAAPTSSRGLQCSDGDSVSISLPIAGRVAVAGAGILSSANPTAIIMVISVIVTETLLLIILFNTRDEIL